jgi:WD40 repeat-containing protein SMU1
VWDFDTGKLCKELKYQKEEDFMMHDHAVLCLAFSLDGDLLASGDSAGMIKVWRLQNGACVRKFPSAHTKGVSSIEFAKDGTQLLSASQDNTVRIHGLKSGRTLKEFRGHTSFVTAAIYSDDGQQIISGSSDGAVKIWDMKTTECLRTFTPNPGQTPVSVLGVSRLPKHPDRLIVATRSPTLRVMSTNGQVIQTYSLTSGDVVAYTASPKGNFVYAVGNDCVMYAFSTETAKLEHVLKLHKKDVVGVAHHPHRNIFASFSQDGTLKIWRP